MSRRSRLNITSRTPGKIFIGCGRCWAFVVTNCPPHKFLATTAQIVKDKLTRLTESEILAALVVICISPLRKERPTIGFIREQIIAYFQTLTVENYENKRMAD